MRRMHVVAPLINDVKASKQWRKTQDMLGGEHRWTTHNKTYRYNGHRFSQSHLENNMPTQHRHLSHIHIKSVELTIKTLSQTEKRGEFSERVVSQKLIDFM